MPNKGANQELIHAINCILIDTRGQPALTDQELLTGLLQPLCGNTEEALFPSK